MAWKVTGNRYDGNGPVRDLYVFEAFSEAEARNTAAREQLISRSVHYVPDSEVPYDAWRVVAARPRVSRVSGAKRSLEAIGNGDMTRRPVRTLALGVGLGVFGGLVLFVFFMWVLALMIGGISIGGRY